MLSGGGGGEGGKGRMKILSLTKLKLPRALSQLDFNFGTTVFISVSSDFSKNPTSSV